MPTRWGMPSAGSVTQSDIVIKFVTMETGTQMLDSSAVNLMGFIRLGELLCNMLMLNFELTAQHSSESYKGVHIIQSRGLPVDYQYFNMFYSLNQQFS